MSYILEALRKSHHDRERSADRILQQNTAELRRSARQRRLLLWVGIGLFGANVLLLGWLASDRLLTQRDDVAAAGDLAASRTSNKTETTPTRTTPAALTRADAATGAGEPTVAPSVSRETASTTGPSLATDPTHSPAAEGALGTTKPMSLNDATLVARDMALERQQDFERRRSVVTPTSAPETVTVGPSSMASHGETLSLAQERGDVAHVNSPGNNSVASQTVMADAELGSVPLFMNMDDAFRSHWTALSLDVHVFSPTPIERFVFINMEKYREGDTTKEGLLVSHIVADGVILEGMGQRFRLTPQ